MVTVRHVTERATAALDGLARTGEAIDDEWQYVVDLGDVWAARLADVVASRGDEEVAPEVAAAVDRAAQEAASIDDPHRAIDWLSTFPQIVLLTLAEPA